MKNIKVILALALAAAMIFSFAACGTTTDDDGDDTEVTTTEKTAITTKSSQTQVKSDYDIDKPNDLQVNVGTSYEDVIAMLPSTVGVLEAGTSTATSEVLYTQTFDDPSEVENGWDLYLPAGGYDIGGGRIAITTNSTTTKMALPETYEWMHADSDDEYANYAVKIVMRGTADNPTNNFGLMLRAHDVNGSGPDSYSGLYVGIGDSNGQICIGHANNNWSGDATYDFDYEANKDFTIEVLLYNETMVILLDGEAVGEYSAQGFVNGTVGIRTYDQVFEVSEFTVRTLGADDFEYFQNGFSSYVEHPVTWSCTDYDANVKGRYGFIGTVTDLEKAAVKVNVQVKE